MFLDLFMDMNLLNALVLKKIEGRLAGFGFIQVKQPFYPEPPFSTEGIFFSRHPDWPVNFYWLDIYT